MLRKHCFFIYQTKDGIREPQGSRGLGEGKKRRPDGTLTVSDIILWQDEVCCNSYLNISTEERADEEDIFESY